MSRSRKKNPVCGITCSDSEKQDKRIINRALRRISRAITKKDEGDSIYPLKNSILSLWEMDKDGKQRFDKDHWFYKKVLRK